jgi:hypothetical protein
MKISLLAGLALAAALAIGIGAASRLRHGPDEAADAQFYTVTGPPCPTLTAAAYGAGAIKVGPRFEYGDVTFGRAYGYVSCGWLPGGLLGLTPHPVCEFTNPGVMEVQTPTGPTYFAPGLGQPATVAVTDGQPRCVLGSHFR